MHAIDPRPRLAVVAAAAALAAALMVALLSPSVGDVSLQLGGSGAHAAPAVGTPTAAHPYWLRHPLASPLRDLR
jgi:hypothetical protein